MSEVKAALRLCSVWTVKAGCEPFRYLSYLCCNKVHRQTSFTKVLMPVRLGTVLVWS